MKTPARTLASTVAVALAAGCAALNARAADAAPDVDPLALQSDAPVETPAAGSTRMFAEAAAGVGEQRDGASRNLGRITLDGRRTFGLAASTQLRLSARLEGVHPRDARLDNPILSLREAALVWQDGQAQHIVEAGRINLRDGPGYGYNPIDFFRDRTLRAVTTADPIALREQRMGTVMLRGQKLWSGGSLALALAPRLDRDGPSSHGMSADLGATNDRNRAALTLGTRWSEQINTTMVLYGESGGDPRVGIGATALVAPSLVTHLEAGYGREPTLLARAVGPAAAAAITREDSETSSGRASVGLTWTGIADLSATLEFQHNGFALGRDGWRTLGSAPAAAGAYFITAQAQQDNASRNAVLLYVSKHNVVMRNLDLTVLAKHNATDRSHLTWLELRYRFDRIELALQGQWHHGSPWSEFGIIPLSRSAGAVATLYF